MMGNVEFLPGIHIYLNSKGVIIPSVTQLIQWKFGSGYDEVPKRILEEKAKYGTRIHSLIEMYHKQPENCVPKTPYEVASVRAYKNMAGKLPAVAGNEKLVCFKDRLAGQIDLVYQDGSLGDIKTYAAVDDMALFKVKWQLSLYYFCLNGNDDKYVNTPKCRLVHVPKSMKYGIYDVDLYGYDECLSLLEDYENCH